IGRYTFVGVRPYRIVTARGDDVRIEYTGRGRKNTQVEATRSSAATERPRIIEVLRKLLREHKPAQVPGLPPFTAGAVGYLAYDVVRQLEKLPQSAKDDVGVPDAVFMFFDRLLAFDHVRHEIHIMAAADVRHEKPARAYQRALRDIAT